MMSGWGKERGHSCPHRTSPRFAEVLKHWTNPQPPAARRAREPKVAVRQPALLCYALLLPWTHADFLSRLLELLRCPVS